MSEISVHWDEKVLNELSQKWPKRSKWAMGEALKMTGGHLRKKLRDFIERGGSGWPPLAIQRHGRTPLYNLGKLARWKYTGGVTPTVKIGFFTETKRGKSDWNKRERARFKKYFGVSPAMLAKKHEMGKSIRVTEKMRKYMGAIGVPLKKETKTILIPARPMISPVYAKEEPKIGSYIADRFWAKMTGEEGPRG